MSHVPEKATLSVEQVQVNGNSFLLPLVRK